MRFKFILAIALILCAFSVIPVNAGLQVGNIDQTAQINSTLTMSQTVNYGGYPSLSVFDNGQWYCSQADYNKLHSPATSSYTVTSLFKIVGVWQNGVIVDVYHYTVNVNVEPTQPPIIITPATIQSELISESDNSRTYRVQAIPDSSLSEGMVFSEIGFNSNPSTGTLTSEQTIKYVNIGSEDTTVYCKWYIPAPYTYAGEGVISATLYGTSSPVPTVTPTTQPTTQPTTTPTTSPTVSPTQSPLAPENIFPTGDLGLQLITGKALDDNVLSHMGLYKIEENSVTTNFKEGERIYFYIENLDYVSQISNGIGTVDFSILNYDTMENVFPTQRYKNNWSENNQWQYKSDSSSTIYNIGSNTDEKTLNFVASMSGQYLELPAGRYRCYVNVRYGGDVYSPNLILTGFYTDFAVKESDTAPKLTFTIESINYDTGNQLQGVNLTVYEYHEYDNSLQEIYSNAHAPAKVQLMLPSSTDVFIQANINGYALVNEQIFDYLNGRKGKLMNVALGSSRLYFTKLSSDIQIDKTFMVKDDNLQPVQNVAVVMDNAVTLYTNEYGGVRFNNISQGVHSFTFSKSGFNTLNLNVDVSITSISDVQIFRIVTPTPTGYPTVYPTVTPTDSAGKPIYTPIEQPKNIADSVKYGLAHIFGVNSLETINLVFALIIILFPAVVGGVITSQALGFVAGGMFGFVFALAIGLLPIWVFFCMVLFTVLYLIMTTGDGF